MRKSLLVALVFLSCSISHIAMSNDDRTIQSVTAYDNGIVNVDRTCEMGRLFIVSASLDHERPVPPYEYKLSISSGAAFETELTLESFNDDGTRAVRGADDGVPILVDVMCHPFTKSSK